jgi:hypothetical protein
MTADEACLNAVPGERSLRSVRALFGGHAIDSHSIVLL